MSRNLVQAFKTATEIVQSEKVSRNHLGLNESKSFSNVDKKRILEGHEKDSRGTRKGFLRDKRRNLEGQEKDSRGPRK